MEILSEYYLAGEKWEIKEDDQLIKEYNIDKLNLLDICKIHKRKPGGIMSRLKKLNLIDMKNNARGYQDYEQSDLYEKKVNNTILESNIINNTTYTKLQRKQISSDIIEIKKDLKEIKENISKIFELINLNIL